MITLRPPQHSIHGTVRVSGSKSLSNRLLVLDHIFQSGLSLHNLSDSEDTTLLCEALIRMKMQPGGLIDVGHAGTDFRFLTALLCVTPGEWTLTGSSRMKQRPIGELVQALRTLGAEISYMENEHFPPLRIKGKQLSGGALEIDGSISSQFISALLLIAPGFERSLELRITNTIVSRPYIDMTVSLLRRFGVSVEEYDATIKVIPSRDKALSFHELHIESDWSSASYWYSLCALSKGAAINLVNYNQQSLQADAVLPELYSALGVATTFSQDAMLLQHKGNQVRSFSYDFTNCPDIAQTLAFTCAGLGIEAHLTGLQTLRIKETDRIAALKQELEKTGVEVHVTGSSLQMKPGKALKGRGAFRFSAYNDHRMVMSAAALSLVGDGIEIEDEQVVGKSYPAFWEDLKSLGFNVHLQP